MGNIGPLELGIVLVIVLLIFGPKRLPGLGRQLGSGMREFKDSITGANKDDDDDESVAGLPAAPPDTVASTPAPVAVKEPSEPGSSGS
jgi:sec-independent protein translocase protein TatA